MLDDLSHEFVDDWPENDRAVALGNGNDQRLIAAAVDQEPIADVVRF